MGLFHFAAKESKKLDGAQENKRTAVRERDQAQRVLDDLQGIERVPAPKPKTPKPKTVIGKVWKWTKDNVAMSGEMPVTSIPLHTTKPSTVSDSRVPTYTQTSQHTSNMGQWESVQAMQQQQMFERNMAYQSPPITTPSQPLSLGSGLANNVQMPPSDWSSLGSERHSCADIR